MEAVIILTRALYWSNIYQHAIRQLLGEKVLETRVLQFASTSELPGAVEQQMTGLKGHVWCLVDPGQVRPDDLLLSRASADAGWLAELLLSFPDVGFLVSVGAPGPVGPARLMRADLQPWGIALSDLTTREGLEEFSHRVAELGARTTELFDPTGARTLLREAAWLENDNVPLTALATRPRPGLALSVDDEEQYALTHAHACYTAGLSVRAVWSQAQATLAFGGADQAPEKDPAPVLAIMDWDIRFNDQRGDWAEDDDAEKARTNLLDALARRPSPIATGPTAVLVISALEPEAIMATAEAKGSDSFMRIRALSAVGAAHALRKPVGGLIHVADLARSMISAGTILRAHLPDLGQARGHDRHSAPYRRHVVAGRLISRARKALTGNGSPELSQCISAAVMTYDARLLLGGLARTSIFEALALQFEAEVRAELSFLGFAGALDSRRRLMDLEAHAIEARGADYERQTKGLSLVTGRWDASVSNFLVVAIDRLRRVYGEQDQVEAADECLVQISRHQRRLLLLHKSRPLPKHQISAPVRILRWLTSLIRYVAVLYFDWSTRSGTSIGAWARSLLILLALNAIALLIVLRLTPGFHFPIWPNIAEYLVRSLYYSLVGADAHSLLSTLSADSIPLPEHHRVGVLVVEATFRILIGVVHVGILLGLLYRRIIRRAA